MEILFYIWIVLGSLMILLSVFAAGYISDSELGAAHSRDEIIFGGVFAAITLPFIISLVIIMLPFYGLYKLGEYLRNK